MPWGSLFCRLALKNSTAEKLSRIVPVAAPVHSDADLPEPRVEHVRTVAGTGDPHPVEREGNVALARDPVPEPPHPPRGHHADVLARAGAADLPGIVTVEDPAGTGHRTAVAAAEVGVPVMEAQLTQAVLAALAVEGLEVVSRYL